MMQIPVPQTPQIPQYTSQPSYNAVKIDIHNPQVNAPGYSSNPIPTPYTAPVYDYPQAPVYEMPQKSIYNQPQIPSATAPSVTPPSAVKELPSVPAPVIVPSAATVAPVTTTPVTAPEEKVETAAPVVAPETATIPAAIDTPAPAQTVEVKTPEATAPKVDVNDFINKLTNPDYEIQANALESIADIAQTSPDKATDFLDVKVIDTLIGIMQADSSKLTGPTPEQLQIREKIVSGKPVTDAETAEATKISPMEQAERNKQYAIYTVAILQKLYGSEIEKINNTVVPLTELPGAAGVVEQIKNNPNPMVRTSGIDALSYIQRPEYKQDLTTVFTVAQKDQDENVKQAATKALDKLSQIADPTPAPASVVTPDTSSSAPTEQKVA